MQTLEVKHNSAKPFVSWLIPTSLYGHHWWKRLAEFLHEDFPSEQIECIFYNTQDENFNEKAYEIGFKVYQSFAHLPGVTEKWNTVKFVQNFQNNFNVSEARNALADIAQGEVLIYRDADCQLLQPSYTRFLVDNLLKHELGIVGVPSIKHGFHHKPEKDIVSIEDERYAGILLTPTVNGMSTAILKSVLLEAGGWNPGLLNWGEHVALCTKLARMGFTMGYAVSQGFWLSTSHHEADFMLSDPAKNHLCNIMKAVGYELLCQYYHVKSHDTFAKRGRSIFKFSSQVLGYGYDIESLIQQQWKQFHLHQYTSNEVYSFKPLDCLSNKKHTDNYLNGAKSVAAPFFFKTKQTFQKILSDLEEKGEMARAQGDNNTEYLFLGN